MPRAGPAPDGRCARDRVQDRRARVEVHRVAELVRLGRAAGFDAGRHLARVVPAEAALADRSEQIAQRAIAEEVEALVGDLELERRFRCRRPAPGRSPPLALAVEIRRGGDVALLLQLLDDLLDQLVEPRFRVVARPASPCRAAARASRRTAGRRSAAPRGWRRAAPASSGPSSPGIAVRVVEAARQQQIGQLRQQLLEVELVEIVAGVLRVAVFHV